MSQQKKTITEKCPTSTKPAQKFVVLGTANGQPSFAVKQWQFPLPSFLGSTLAVSLGLQVLVDGRQVAYVVDGATQDGHLGDAAIAAGARDHVAQPVEVALEVVAALALHHVVLRPLVPLVVTDTAVGVWPGRRRRRRRRRRHATRTTSRSPRHPRVHAPAQQVSKQIERIPGSMQSTIIMPHTMIVVGLACLRWPRKHVLDEIPPWEGAIWGLSGPLKSIESLCCSVCSKGDHSIVNNGTTCDAAFHQTSLTPS